MAVYIEVCSDRGRMTDAAGLAASGESPASASYDKM
jgi:hypothetical protein